MDSWKLEGSGKLTFDRVDRVVVGTVEGAVSVVGTDGEPTLEVLELTGSPLRVRHEDGVLTVDYERPPRPGPLSWLSGWGRRYRAVLSLAVPRDCRVELRVVSASLMVSGLRAPVRPAPSAARSPWPAWAARPTPRRSPDRSRPPGSPATSRPPPCPAT
jgi:hypothetical protein